MRLLLQSDRLCQRTMYGGSSEGSGGFWGFGAGHLAGREHKIGRLEVAAEGQDEGGAVELGSWGLAKE